MGEAGSSSTKRGVSGTSCVSEMLRGESATESSAADIGIRWCETEEEGVSARGMGG